MNKPKAKEIKTTTVFYQYKCQVCEQGSMTVVEQRNHFGVPMMVVANNKGEYLHVCRFDYNSIRGCGNRVWLKKCYPYTVEKSINSK